MLSNIRNLLLATYASPFSQTPLPQRLLTQHSKTNSYKISGSSPPPPWDSKKPAKLISHPIKNRSFFKLFPLVKNTTKSMLCPSPKEYHASSVRAKGLALVRSFRPDGQKIIFASSHSDPFLDDPDFDPAVPGYQRAGQNYAQNYSLHEHLRDQSRRIKTNATYDGRDYHAECAYSPDGSKIVFASNTDSKMNLYTMKSDGTDIQQVTHTECYNGGPFFSPDGTRIIFRADPEKKDYLQIYVINTNGSNERQLTTNGAVKSTLLLAPERQNHRLYHLLAWPHAL